MVLFQSPANALSRHCIGKTAFLLFFLLFTLSEATNVDTSSCLPLEIHLGLTEDPTTMRVTWRTQGSSCRTYVRYAAVGDETNEESEAYGSSYIGDSHELCGYVASSFTFELYLHTVLLEGLVPNSRYQYHLPSDDRIFTFQASRQSGDPSNYVFYIFGDMGVTTEDSPKNENAEVVQNTMRQEFERQEPELILHVGDISYADGEANVWDAFMSAIEPFTTKTAWVALVGNHEYGMRDDGQLDPWGLHPYFPEYGSQENGDSKGECGLQLYWRFPFGNHYPATQKTPSGYLIAPPFGSPFPPFYFSFDHGVVHFVMLSTEHDVEPGSPQLTWLENDLASVDRCKTPFVVATGHRPFYAPMSDPKDYETGRGLRSFLEDVLIRYNVDVFVSGHIHLYYHVCEARNLSCVSNGEGLTSIVIGTGGRELGFGSAEEFDLELETFLPVYGFGKATVHGTDRLEFELVEAGSGQVMDVVTFNNQQLCTLP